MSSRTAESPARRRWLLGSLAIVLGVAAAAAWLVPEELVAQWADWAAPQDLQVLNRALAVRRDVRVLAPAALAVMVLARLTRRAWAAGAAAARAELGRRARTWGMVGTAFVAVWVVLAGWHAYEGLSRLLDDWPVYRLRAGETVLPNISQTNRQVIRGVAARTPPTARILVVSDQKLFFLSYYLLPRRLYHRMHPATEFLVPRPFDTTPLPAYRLEDLDPRWVASLRPDDVLEYFERPRQIRLEPYRGPGAGP